LGADIASNDKLLDGLVEQLQPQADPIEVIMMKMSVLLLRLQKQRLLLLLLS
jgi:hypothetical protein